MEAIQSFLFIVQLLLGFIVYVALAGLAFMFVSNKGPKIILKYITVVYCWLQD